MPGRAHAVGRERVADAAQLVLGAPAAAVDDLRAEPLRAEGGILVGVPSAETVVDMQRGDAIAELCQDVPETARVRAARDEAGHLGAGLQQLVLADVRRDAVLEDPGVHGDSVVPRGIVGA